jgi:hypothetical protein
MSTLKPGDLVRFRENEDTPAHGIITRIWNKPVNDPYVTIEANREYGSQRGRTFVRCSSRVTPI